MFWPVWYFRVQRALKAELSSPPHSKALLFPQVLPANWWGFLFRKLHGVVPLVWMCQEPSAFIHSSDWINAIPNPPLKFAAKLLNPVLKALDCNLALEADAVITNSVFGKRYAREVYGYADERVIPVLLAADLARFRPALPEGRLNQIVTVGRLTKFKNIELIIRALAALRSQSFPDLNLIIVGRGEDEQRLKSLVSELGLSTSVQFRSSVTDAELVSELQASLAFVLASRNEPFGLVAVEAMACGTPAVVHCSGGPSETVIDGQTGAFFTELTPQSIANAVSRVIGDRLRYSEFSNRAARHAQTFNWDTVTDQLEATLTRQFS